MRVSLIAAAAAVALLLPALCCAQTCGFGGLDVSALSSYDLLGVDGSAGSNEDSLYFARICGAVTDPTCAALPSGSMFCRHAWPDYSATPNGGTVADQASASCANNVQQLAPAYSTSSANTVWGYVNAGQGAAGGIVMSTVSPTSNTAVCSSGGSAQVNVQFLCAPLQTTARTFNSISVTGCNYTLTLYTSLACTAA